MKYKNLYLIGTSHISKDSVKEVEKTILKVRPRFVAIELDRRRLSLLENKKKSRISFKDIRNLGLKGFLLNLIGAWFEKKMGKKVGVEPGSEMKMAINLSKKLNINLVLIDQDIKFTINQLLSRITRKEKFRFIKDLFFGNETNFDIKKVPSQREIKKIIDKIKKDYPSFYLTIIKERNIYMAQNLHKLMQKYPDGKIVAVIGAGHEKDILGEIKLLEKI
ncbi:TraB/GumN family protein [Candidatus Woesearchaeota archaeon]|nr:TraB/GumN family protein [Candidatus Woesearchaeota archaeon]